MSGETFIKGLICKESARHNPRRGHWRDVLISQLLKGLVRDRSLQAGIYMLSVT